MSLKANFKLADIEQYIDDELLIAAERITLTGLKEIEKHLWQAQVAAPADDEGLRPELLITPSRTKARSCDCEVGQEGHWCAHTVALALAVREARARTAKPKKITTASILKEVSHRELMEFVQLYARRNRAFANGLKMHFTLQLGGTDDELRLRDVIESAVKSTSRTGRITSAKAKKIAKQFDLLLDQTDVLITQRDYLGAIRAYRIYLEYLAQLDARSGDQVFAEQIVRIGDTLKTIHELDPPPAVVEQLRDLARRAVEESGWRVTPHYELYLRLYAELGDLSELVAAHFGRMTDYVQQTAIELLARQANDEELPGIIATYLPQHTDTVTNVLKGLYGAKRRHAAIDLVRHLLRDTDYDAIDYEGIAMRAIDVAKDNEQHDAVAEMAWAAFERTLNTAFYKDYRTYGDGAPIDLTQAFVEYRALEARGYKRESLSHIEEFILKVLLLEQRTEELADWLRHEKDLRLLRRTTREFFRLDPERAMRVHEELVLEYLESYVGPPPAELIGRIVQRILQAGQFGKARELIGRIKARYGDRPSLMRELKKY